MYQPFLRSLLVLSLVPTLSVLGQGVIAPAHGACADTDGKCRCGSTVISNTVLSSDPILQSSNNPCPCDGLVVDAAVKKLVIVGTIQGSNACTGIRLESGVTDLVVKQGQIKGFDVGIDASRGVTRSVFTALKLLDNTTGILLVGDDNTVVTNIVQGGFGGIDVAGDRNVVRLNKVTDACGIFANGSDNTVSRNVCVGGHFEISGQRAIVDQNKVTDGLGIDVSGTGHTFTGNISARSFVTGFSVFGTDHTFDANKATNSFDDGFSVNATMSRFRHNFTVNNDRFGIEDFTRDHGTSGTTNTYTSNICIGDTSGKSDPLNLCK